MKVGTITSANSKVVIQSDIAKIGFRFKYALGGVFTQALALSKWVGLVQKIDIITYLPSGSIQTAYKLPFNAVAEIGAFDESSVEIIQSVTANFAEAFGSIEITTGGTLDLGESQIHVEVSGLAVGEEIHIYALDMPVRASNMLKYELERIEANVPKRIDLGNAISIAVNEKVIKIDALVENGVRNIYDADEIRIINNEVNDTAINVAGLAMQAGFYRCFPVNIHENATIYADSATEIVVVRVI